MPKNETSPKKLRYLLIGLKRNLIKGNPSKQNIQNLKVNFLKEKKKVSRNLTMKILGKMM
jgi:hypothetical protein